MILRFKNHTKEWEIRKEVQSWLVVATQSVPWSQKHQKVGILAPPPKVTWNRIIPALLGLCGNVFLYVNMAIAVPWHMCEDHKATSCISLHLVPLKHGSYNLLTTQWAGPNYIMSFHVPKSRKIMSGGRNLDIKHCKEMKVLLVVCGRGGNHSQIWERVTCPKQYTSEK